MTGRPLPPIFGAGSYEAIFSELIALGFQPHQPDFGDP